MIEKNRLKYMLLLCAVLALFSFGTSETARAFSNQVIQKGAVGDDVIELQARLQYIGYYKGTIDGVFGYSTYWALRNFQKAYGMPVDGLAGPGVKKKLVKASKYDAAYVKSMVASGKKFTYYGGTKKQAPKTAAKKPDQTATNVPNGFSQNDIRLLQRAVYGEARGEPYEGQVAVAAVILNRIESPSFPNTIPGVIFEPGAFTCVSDGQIWLAPNDTAKKAVLDAINGWDPSGNALYYFNPATATSKWIWSRPQIKRIGKHIFCK
ncbi:spore cortex-lytic enzyme [Heyndrickxia coagulans]|uniref:spore cortex-lytic enzyme n=1 Tax=Heyndrickxia coagulans TaxID=1398 RepID=UPI003D225C07